METIEYQDVVSTYDIGKLPISFTTTEVNLTGSWKFFKPIFIEKISPCSFACPNNINIPKYIFYLLKNDITTAVKILRNNNPFPATCGRVCPHFCQFQCNRSEFDNSIEIREIEKFLGDYALNIPYEKPEIRFNKKIAVVGGGPAGLSCAYFLAKNGYYVTVFEKENNLGGILKYGIPEYRLPKDIVDKEIKNIIEIGNITVKFNSPIDKERVMELSNEYNAIFIAIGLGKSNIPNNLKIDNNKILSGYDFLKKLNLDYEYRKKIKNEKIAIIGGGNVAFDVARTVLRLGNKVDIIYRRSLNEAPAFEDEKKEGIEEGVKIKERLIVDDIVKVNEKLKLTLKKVISLSSDRIETGEEFKENYDRVIVATGQKKEFNINEEKNIFIGGDFKYGARTVVEAIASGKKNAFKIINYLNGAKFEETEFYRSEKDYDKFEIVDFKKINIFYFKKQSALKIEKLPSKERIKNFREINIKPSLEKILNEAKRCFSCGVCNLCKTCWFSCPDISISVEEEIVFDYDHCKGCGLCSTECPRGIIEMVEDK